MQRSRTLSAARLNRYRLLRTPRPYRHPRINCSIRRLTVCALRPCCWCSGGITRGHSIRCFRGGGQVSITSSCCPAFSSPASCLTRGRHNIVSVISMHGEPCVSSLCITVYCCSRCCLPLSFTGTGTPPGFYGLHRLTHFRGPSVNLTAVLGLIGTTILSALSYRYFETPFLRMKSRFTVK